LIFKDGAKKSELLFHTQYVFALKLKKAKKRKVTTKLPLFSWKKISLKKSVAD